MHGIACLIGDLSYRAALVSRLIRRAETIEVFVGDTAYGPEGEYLGHYADRGKTHRWVAPLACDGHMLYGVREDGRKMQIGLMVLDRIRVIKRYDNPHLINNAGIAAFTVKVYGGPWVKFDRYYVRQEELVVDYHDGSRRRYR